MANNCGTHQLSVPNGQLCPKCYPGDEKSETHLQKIANAVTNAISDEVDPRAILKSVSSLVSALSLPRVKDQPPRGARFTVLEDCAGNDNADYIVLDIPTQLVGQVFDEIDLCHRAVQFKEEQGEPVDPQAFWCVHLLVEPHHPKSVGLTKADGSSPEVEYLPSLLTPTIRRD